MDKDRQLALRAIADVHRAADDHRGDRHRPSTPESRLPTPRATISRFGEGGGFCGRSFFSASRLSRFRGWRPARGYRHHPHRRIAPLAPRRRFQLAQQIAEAAERRQGNTRQSGQLLRRKMGQQQGGHAAEQDGDQRPGIQRRLFTRRISGEPHSQSTSRPPAPTAIAVTEKAALP